MALESLLFAAALAAATPQRLFVSGHSLIDEPLPGHMQRIAASLGAPLHVERELRQGSSIRERARLNARLDGFDALVITEQHGVLVSLMWQDTVAELRRYQDRFAAANPRGRSWFYEPWLGVDDFADPRAWIAYERAASPVWQCAVGAVNRRLAAAGRADRIEPLPAAAALALLVERATSRAGLPGLSGANARETMQRLFADDVHLQPLGSYYMALVVFASLADRSPAGAWAPGDVAPATAAALQSTAWEAVRGERAARAVRSPAQCRDALQPGFIARYWAYVRDARKDQPSSLLRWWQWARQRALTHWRLRRDAPDHPFAD